ncbi:hypothetical protein EJB05_35559 [Eragrostis curvula]|uniref:TPX2 C-terminal domain-containing protein n=1 Tax=Eragrostis curvula TaxID=38414 RepID=A0A5J9U6S0_9POAL|nr:hypothetical protein EJB05_35559 [Eragrostis curvula]
MATEVNQNYFSWSQEESSVQDISQGTTRLFGHGSISFGRFDLESLEWEKWSVFTNDRRNEEFGKFNGLVAKKKAYFEEYFKRIRELKALQQQNQQTELNLDYCGDGSDSSQTGEDEPAGDHGTPTGSGALLDDSREQKIPTTKFEHEVEHHDDHENGSLVSEISASTHSSSVGGLQQISKQVRGNVSVSIDMSLQNAYSRQDDPGMVHETSMTPKRTIEKESRIGQGSKLIPKTVKTTSSNGPAQTIASKVPCSGKSGVINQMAKPERRPRGATCDLVRTTGGSGIIGLRRPSTASQRPSSRERRPISRNASRKPAEVTTPCRPSTSERRSATRESALKHANNTTPRRPSTADRRPITKESAPKQFNIATPSRSTTDRHAITKESAPKLSNIATPRRPSTADRRPTTKESAPKLSNVATPRRPSTADRRPTTKESAPKLSKAGNLHRPSTGERRTTTSDMATKHVATATSCRPSADKQRPVSRESARKHADVVTLRRPSTAERRPATRDVASKHAIAPPPHRPSTSQRRPIGSAVAPKHVPLCRPSTAERRPVSRESALKPGNAARLRWPLTPDRYISKKSESSTPQRPSTGERRPIANDNTLKSDQKTPVRLRAVPNYSNGAMFAAVTPRKAVTPNLVKSSKPENISYVKEKVELHADGKPKSSCLNLRPRQMLTSSVRDEQVLDNFRKPNKEGFQERVQAQALASNNTTPSQTRSVKMGPPIPPPPPPPPRRPSNIERTANVNNLPASGRKPKASTPRWH